MEYCGIKYAFSRFRVNMGVALMALAFLAFGGVSCSKVSTAGGGGVAPVSPSLTQTSQGSLPAQSKRAKPASESRWEPTNVQYGKGTWYGKSAHGKKTASGRRFDKNEYTAAHRTLPFGTVVRVYRQSDERHVLAVITDRGPFGAGMIVDLSKRAGDNLGLLQSGVAPVAVEVVSDREGKPLNDDNSFYLRLEEAEDLQTARNLCSTLSSSLSCTVTPLKSSNSQGGYLICAGPYATFGEAESAMESIEPKTLVGEVLEAPTRGGTVPGYTAPADSAPDLEQKAQAAPVKAKKTAKKAKKATRRKN